MRFNLASLAGKTVQAATLVLVTVAGYYGGSPVVTAYRVLDANDWVLAEATWNNRKAATAWAGAAGCVTSGTDYDVAPVAGGVAVPAGDAQLTSIIFDANGIADLQAQIAGPNQGYVFHMNNNGYAQFGSANHGTPAYRPYLTVVYS